MAAINNSKVHFEKTTTLSNFESPVDLAYPHGSDVIQDLAHCRASALLDSGKKIHLSFELDQRKYDLSLCAYLQCPKGQRTGVKRIDLKFSFLKASGEVGFVFECSTEKHLLDWSNNQLCEIIRPYSELPLVDGLFPEEYLVDNTITVRIEADFYAASKTSEILKTLIENAERSTNGIYLKLFESGKLSDVTLEVMSGRAFAVHSAIMGAHSPVFEAMFSTEMAEKAQRRVAIDDMDGETAEHLLKYIYSGKVSVAEYPLVPLDLFVAADKYQLTYFKSVLEEIICLNLDSTTLEEARKLYSTADALHAEKLKAKSLACIKSHSKKLIDSLDNSEKILQLSQMLETFMHNN